GDNHRCVFALAWRAYPSSRSSLRIQAKESASLVVGKPENQLAFRHRRTHIERSIFVVPDRLGVPFRVFDAGSHTHDAFREAGENEQVAMHKWRGTIVDVVGGESHLQTQPAVCNRYDHN